VRNRLATETQSPQRQDHSEINTITKRMIGCPIQVHNQLGPGLLEGRYESALCVEFDLGALRYRRQVSIPVTYKGRVIGDHRLDLVVQDLVVVGLKACDRLDPICEAQVQTYLKISGKKVGPLINFNSRVLAPSIQRFSL
jgi:GxxExxY protein